jgi:hypothetical protein
VKQTGLEAVNRIVLPPHVISNRLQLPPRRLYVREAGDRTAYVVPADGFQGTAGRNTMIGPGSKQVDFSVSKRIPLGATRLEFRAEILNLFNTTNFGQPDGNISNVTAGVISSADDARNMQFGIRLAW